MRHFFIKNFKKEGKNLLIFEKEKIHQIKNVLRKKPNEKVIFFDETGHQYLSLLKEIKKDFILAQIIETKLPKKEPKIKIWLYQSLLKRKNFEMVLKYSVSLGVEKIIPLISERTIIRKVEEKKLKRWQKIIIESCQQSQRIKIPKISPPQNFLEAVKSSKAQAKLIAHPSASNLLKKILKKEFLSLAIFVGPEGGFSEKEITFAKKYGFFDFKIQDLILRSEIAPLVILSQILFYYLN